MHRVVTITYFLWGGGGGGGVLELKFPLLSDWLAASWKNLMASQMMNL